MLEHLFVGFQQALQWQTLLAMLVGEVVGILVGAAPGLTVTMAVSLMLPITFVLSPVAAMAMLLGVYTGGFMGNSIPAILIKIPGTPSAAATVFDGYALAQKGEAGKALGVSIIASLYGGLFSLICLVLIAPQLAKVALQFGSAEVFSLLLFGMSIICSFAQHSLVKGIISGVLGLMLVTVGLDPLLGSQRFTFGHVALTQGVSLIPAMIGIFAVPQVLDDLVAKGSQAAEAFKPKLSAMLPSWREIRGLFGTFNRASIIGTIIGIIPGTGGPIATFMAYDYERRVSRDPQRFGHGAIEGVAASAGADNGVTGGALVPMLTLGIPGDPVTAVMLGALTIQGLRPGPLLFEQHAPFVYGLFASLLLANLLAALMTLVAVRFSVQLLRLPKASLGPVVLLLCIIGAYSIDNSYFDVGTMLVFGLLGFVLQRYRFPTVPVVLALVLGPSLETNFRRALVESRGDPTVFVTQPISLFFLVLAMASVLAPLRARNKRAKPRPTS
jgi:putative tricarboxylic transport membrane protein